MWRFVESTSGEADEEKGVWCVTVWYVGSREELEFAEH